MDLLIDRIPQTIDQAVDQLLDDLSFHDRSRLANLDESRLVQFHKSYGIFIRSEFRLPGNHALMASCQRMVGVRRMTPQQASYVILRYLHQRLQREHVLRLVPLEKAPKASTPNAGGPPIDKSKPNDN